uniref:Small ribosomal subunit protein uS17 n=1 Tax=uncultured delta proteobacterium Rifle_16ft_4_minimus_10129 TaxID=1665172 RepID=A0A0H4SZW6_9DELT|nr:30S ribosomal protein S17, small subunit ribosomal protein S17 [uncultured delta proteobacterium Rifle_16ft_4_minimus_10129]
MKKSPGIKKTFVGRVIGGGMDKTAVVAIDTLRKHARYGKFVRRRVKYFAHDEKNECKTGDKVAIVECRPLSRLKRWRVKEIVEKSR